MSDGDFVTLSVIEAGEGAFHDAQIRLYDDSDAVVAHDDDAGPGFLPALRMRVPAGGGGTWKVAVTGFGDADFDGVGHSEDLSYQLVIGAEPPAFSEPTPDNNGTQALADSLGSGDFEATAPGSVAVINGSLSDGDIDHFSFPVTVGRRLSIAIYDEDGGAFRDPIVALLDASAIELARDDDSGPGFLPALSHEAAANTTCDVRVAPFALDTHDYRLVVALAPAPTAALMVCDANDDAFIDIRDIDLIFAARGTPASGPGDPRDPNADGRITVQDSLLCKLQCGNPQCALPPPPPVQPASCGLLGIEPLALLALIAWRRRSRLRNLQETPMTRLAALALSLIAMGPLPLATPLHSRSPSLPASLREHRRFGGVDVLVSDLGSDLVAAFDLDVLYDPSVLQATNVVFGDTSAPRPRSRPSPPSTWRPPAPSISRR